MILLREHRGIEYTIETWDLLHVSTVVWMFPLRPHAAASQVWSVAEADAFCKKFIEEGYQLAKNVSFAQLYGANPQVEE